jgi:hypothetical protein
VDDASDYVWSMFLKHKSDQRERILGFLKQMKDRGTPVSFIRCDNSGENNFLKTTTNKEGLHIQYEFTAPKTPQQNGRVERKFSILYRYMRSMLNQAKKTRQYTTKTMG